MANDECFRYVNINQNADSQKVLLYLLPHKMSSYRYKKFMEKCKKNQIPVAEKYGNKVTHIISELDFIDDVLKRLGLTGSECTRITEEKLFLNTQYLSECLKNGKVVAADATHFLIGKNKLDKETVECTDEPEIPEWACMRQTPLKHQNKLLTDAIEVLEKEADLNGGDLNYSRALAFHRCIAVLKAYPGTIRKVSEVKKLPHVGEHCQKVIQELLEDGQSEEIQKILESEFYKKMKLFTSVFGVGVATAKRWIECGLQDIPEVTAHPLTANIHDERVIFGVAYYDDLSLPVLKCEADYVVQLVKQEVRDLFPGATVTLTGGFRRGKEEGHDIDILISHPEEGKEMGLLHCLLQRLETKGLILNGRHDKRSDTPEKLKNTPKGQYLKSSHDEFEKWYGILKLNTDIRQVSDPVCNNMYQNVTKHGHPEDVTKSVYDPTDDSCESPEHTKLEQIPGSSNARSHARDSGESDIAIKSSFGKRDLGSLEHSTDNAEPPEKRVRHHTGDQLTLGKLAKQARGERWWIARRVDLVVTPASQYYYALVGWTGSKFFNRDLRLYAQRKLGMKLSSHALWDSKSGTFVTASSEQEVFQNLKLQYREPWDRNA